MAHQLRSGGCHNATDLTESNGPPQGLVHLISLEIRQTTFGHLLGFGDAAEDALLATFREIMAVEVDDGVVFDLSGVN